MTVVHIKNGTQEHANVLVFYFEYIICDDFLHLTYRTEESARYDTEYLKKKYKDLEITIEPYGLYANTFFKYN